MHLIEYNNVTSVCQSSHFGITPCSLPRGVLDCILPSWALLALSLVSWSPPNRIRCSLLSSATGVYCWICSMMSMSSVLLSYLQPLKAHQGNLPVVIKTIQTGTTIGRKVLTICDFSDISFEYWWGMWSWMTSLKIWNAFNFVTRTRDTSMINH